MTRSSLSDTDILKLTRYTDPDSKGRVQLSIELPSSGRVVTSSDRLVPAEIKGKVMIAWADRIREQDALDLQEREEQDRLKADAKRASGPAGDASGEAGVTADPSTTSAKRSTQESPGMLPDNPEDMIRMKVAGLLTTKASLWLELKEIQHKVQELDENIAKWTKVAEGLGISLSEPVPATGAETPPEPGTSGDAPHGESDDAKTDEKSEPDGAGEPGGAEPDVRPGPNKGTRKSARRGARAKRSAKRIADRDSAGGS